MGVLSLLIIGALAALQLVFAVATVQSASTAARAAARSISKADDPVASARAAVPNWLKGSLRVQVTGGADPGVRVTIRIKTVLPGVTGPDVSRQAWFPRERGIPPWGGTP